ncbi:ABC transporter ATP-binding protein [Afipia sp. P52-10]|jgi:peptide/nickel transport system ATP-binding protein|uniref:dipeptide ABC transporter ATP-binding protein n=1 Tax=Afipia sp. P52-10 TaxID=1429916 RepID=UPI0003DF2B47|nr:ABC transporter ATP-binding protein [Afipia sp. P52-10]ETR76248.1 ABC transporter ATP-binding protein [Afipia sp. P52-10]
MTDILLSIDRLSVALPAGSDRPYAIENVSLSLARGETVCVVGESGSGKSVLAQATMGLLPDNLPIATGRIVFDGKELTGLSEREYRNVRGVQIGMIFQEPMTSLNPVLTIGAQIDGALAAHGTLSSAQRQARGLDLLKMMRLPSPDTIGRRYVHELSGGQRQRVMIAMALANNPKLLIADEPTTALDVTTQKEILALLATLRRELDLAVLFITHDFGVVAEIADRVVVMKSGQVVEQGPVNTILRSPSDAYTQRLITAVPQLSPSVTTSRPEGPTVLQIDGLTKVYKGRANWLGTRRDSVRALDDVRLAVHRSEVVAIVGESGSGKSTLAQIVTGLLNPDAGHVRLNDQDLSSLSRRARRRLAPKIQMVFQDPFSSLNPRHTIERIITEAPIVHGATPAEAKADMLRLLSLVGLDASAAARYPHAFSGGQRQRIGLARALILKPDLLVADEPVSALDVSVQQQVLALLADIRRTLGLSILFITHDLRVAATVADRIAVMQHGRIVEQGPAAAILDRPTSDYARTLLAAIPGLAWERGRTTHEAPSISATSSKPARPH